MFTIICNNCGSDKCYIEVVEETEYNDFIEEWQSWGATYVIKCCNCGSEEQ